MAEVLSTVSLVAYIVAGVAAVAAVVLFIVLKIPAVIGELTGRTARKNIERIRAANEKSGAKVYRPGADNIARGKTTGTIEKGKRKTEKLGKKAAATEIINTGNVPAEDKTAAKPETAKAVSSSEAETGLLDSGEPAAYSGETAALDDGSGETAPLNIEARPDYDDGSGLTVSLETGEADTAAADDGSGGTEALDGSYDDDDGSAGTEILQPEAEKAAENAKPRGMDLTILEEIMFVHTDEVIE